MNIKSVMIFGLAVITSATSTTVSSAAYVKDNGIIRVRLNDYNYPIITGMWITGALAVPHDNVGADFQMAARSIHGDAYNPTQGGDCTGTPSLLKSVIPNWDGTGFGISPLNGIHMTIQPRNYNEPSYPGCAGVGALLPYDFEFGITLGDNIRMPKEMMVIDMSIRRHPGSEPIVKQISEMPVAYVRSDYLRYAYYSEDGVNFQAMTEKNSSGLYTHDTRQWPYLTNMYRIGRSIMLCTLSDAIQRSTQGICMAFYSDKSVPLVVSHRRGARYDLTLLGATGSADGSQIADYEKHSLRRIMMVGNVGSVASGFTQAKYLFSDWGNW